MPITLSSASLPVFQTALSNLLHCLNKAEANAAARKFDPQVLFAARLVPGMRPFAAQIRIACDAAKNGAARLAGIEAPKFEDNVTTFVELTARIARTLDWLATVPAFAIDGGEDADITFPAGRDRTCTMKGESYLRHCALPNLFFHVVTA